MEAPPKRARGRPPIPQEIQRQRLREGALRAIRDKGFEKVRVADILREAGMSSRSFYQFYESKEDLVSKVVFEIGAELVDDLHGAFQRANEPLARVEYGIEVYMRLLATLPSFDLESLGGRAGREISTARKELVRSISSMVIEALTAAHEAGEVSAPPDPVLVELIFTGFEGLTLRYFAEGRGEELLEKRASLIDLLVRTLL